MHKNIQALGRMKKGRMNKTEQDYARILELRKSAGEILWFEFEPVKFRLADKTFYEPDFMVMLKTGEIEIHEVKGFWMDDAKVKIKCAAEKFPFRFIAVQKKNGAFQKTEF